MSLYSLKPVWLALLGDTEDSLVSSGVTARLLTLATLPISLLIGAAIVIGSADRVIWVLVPVLMIVLMTLNALDGSIARRTGTAGPDGAVLNELADRFADLAVLGAGFAVAPYQIVAIAIVLVLAVEFVAMVGWANSGRRLHTGPLAMPGRFALVGFTALVAIAWADAFAFGYLLIAAGSLLTLFARLAGLVRMPVVGAPENERI